MIDTEAATVERQAQAEKPPTLLRLPQEIIHIKHYISWQQYKYWAFLLQELAEQFEAGIEPDEK